MYKKQTITQEESIRVVMYFLKFKLYNKVVPIKDKKKWPTHLIKDYKEELFIQIWV